MGEPRPADIRLHADPVVRPVLLGEPGSAERLEAATAVVASLLGDPPAVLLTGSCSAALEASAALIDLEPGDEVVVPAFTFPTSIAPFVSRGAVVRFADISPVTANVDPSSVLAKVNDRTRAVVVMHYAGIAVELQQVLPAVAAVGASLVEDAAHGLFAQVGGEPLGTLGRFGALSFHHTKNISALEGGALVVNHPDDVERAVVAVDKGTNRAAFAAGRTGSYEWCGLGSSWRMAAGHVEYLAAELERAEPIQRRRLEVHDHYLRELASWAADQGVGLPEVGPARSGPAHLFFLVLPSPADRPHFVAHCAERGVQAARHYGSMPATPFGATLQRVEDACPVADDLALRLVRIPLHHDLDAGAVDRVVDAVTSWQAGAAG